MTMPNHQPGESERDWTEHFEHENGKYVCQCYKCKELFYGHKRTVICKVCWPLLFDEVGRKVTLSDVNAVTKSNIQQYPPIELKNLKNPE